MSNRFTSQLQYLLVCGVKPKSPNVNVKQRKRKETAHSFLNKVDLCHGHQILMAISQNMGAFWPGENSIIVHRRMGKKGPPQRDLTTIYMANTTDQERIYLLSFT